MGTDVLVALMTGKSIVLNAMKMAEFSQLLESIKGAKS
jgi:hypothetical protein